MLRRIVFVTAIGVTLASCGSRSGLLVSGGVSLGGAAASSASTTSSSGLGGVPTTVSSSITTTTTSGTGGLGGSVGCAPLGDPCASDADCCEGLCTSGTCGGVGPCGPVGDGCSANADCCSGACFGGACQVATCPHTECETGAPISPLCNKCAAILCTAVNPPCCEYEWDAKCVGEASDYCGSCITCLPEDVPCTPGGTPCCAGSCVDGTCGGSTCLASGAACNFPGASCCGGLTCNNGTCGGLCQPQLDGCNASTPPCCNDGVCENGICFPTMCIADGNPCSPTLDCCSGPCNQFNFCGPYSCEPDLYPCTSAAICCGGECNAGKCATSPCPTDGTPCGDCIQSKCCSQASGCLADPMCDMALLCEIACVKNGGAPLACFDECGSVNATFEAAVCVASSCGVGICL